MRVFLVLLAGLMLSGYDWEHKDNYYQAPHHQDHHQRYYEPMQPSLPFWDQGFPNGQRWAPGGFEWREEQNRRKWLW